MAFVVFGIITLLLYRASLDTLRILNSSTPNTNTAALAVVVAPLFEINESMYTSDNASIVIGSFRLYACVLSVPSV